MGFNLNYRQQKEQKIKVTNKKKYGHAVVTLDI